MGTDEQIADRIVDAVTGDSDGDLAAILSEAQQHPRALRLAGERLGEAGWLEMQHALQLGSAIAYAQRKLRRYFAGKPWSGPRKFTLMDALKIADKDLADQVVRRFWSLGVQDHIGLPRPPGRDTDRLG